MWTLKVTNEVSGRKGGLLRELVASEAHVRRQRYKGGGCEPEGDGGRVSAMSALLLETGAKGVLATKWPRTGRRLRPRVWWKVGFRGLSPGGGGGTEQNESRR